MEPLFLQTIANHEFHITNSHRSFYLFPFQEGSSALQYFHQRYRNNHCHIDRWHLWREISNDNRYFSGWSEPDQPAKEFCEDFFIANQKSTWSNQIKMLSGVIRKVRMAGHAPTLSDVSQEVRDDLDERRRNWTTSEDMAEYINEKLGTNLEKDDVNYFMFLYFSSQGLQNPILKYKYKESVDDAEVWIVEDYYTMKKAYLTINGTNYHIQVQGKVNDPND